MGLLKPLPKRTFTNWEDEMSKLHAEQTEKIAPRVENSPLVPADILAQVNGLDKKAREDFMWGFLSVERKLAAFIQRQEVADTDPGKINAFSFPEITFPDDSEFSPNAAALLRTVYRRGLLLCKTRTLVVEDKNRQE
jgi:hypothetical protein